MKKTGYIDKTRIFAGRLFLVVPLVIAGVNSQPALAADLNVTNARIVLPKDDSLMMPGYATIENRTDKEIILIRIRSGSYKLAMIHHEINDRGTPRMVLKSELLIKPNTRIVLKPGDVHFMFAGASGKLTRGSKVTVDLYLNTGEKIPVEFGLVK